MDNSTQQLQPLELCQNQQQPQNAGEQRYATVFSGTVNLIKTIIGAGILGLPFAFARSGILIFVLVFLMVAFISWLSLMYLIYVADATRIYTLGAVCRSL